MKNIHSSVLFFLSLLLFVSCSKKTVDKITSFDKVYDNPQFSDIKIPLDIKQRSDGSYITLAKMKIPSSDFYGIYILKTDNTGKFISDNKMASTYINPVGELLQSGDNLYFICMDNISLNAKLIKIDAGGIAQEVSGIPVTYPLFAALTSDNNNILLLSYDRDNRLSTVSQLGFTGTITSSFSAGIGAGDFNYEQSIADNFTGHGKSLPFLVGQAANGQLFFNGYYNYTLSLVFFAIGSSAPQGVVQGYRDEQCVNSITDLPDNTFALSRYSYDQNFILPKKALANTSASSSTDLHGFPFPELAKGTKVVVKKLTLQGKNVIIYGATTKNSELVLYSYDQASGNLLASKHISSVYPYEMGNFTLNNDQTLTVVATTYVAGRFARITILKLSDTDIQALVGISIN